MAVVAQVVAAAEVEGEAVVVAAVVVAPEAV